MKRIRILGVAIVAVCGLLAISAVSASAAPEWAACRKAVPKKTGNFADKLCSVASEPGKGKYELVGGSIGKGKTFKVKGLGSQTLHIVVPGTGDVPITCTKLKGTAVPVAPNGEKEVNLEFQGCTQPTTSLACENVAKQTIKTNPLSGTLAEVEGKFGTILEPESGSYFVEFACPGLFPKVRVSGEVFGEYTGSTNAISKVSIGHYTVGSYLGEPEPGYTPLTNPPTAGPPTYGVLRSEDKNPVACGEEPVECWGPAGGLPSGQEGEVEVKGEALMIKT